MVYIGPDIPDVKQYTVFNNGLPATLVQKIADRPFFNSLVVPVTRLAQANADLAKEGSALNVIYKKPVWKIRGRNVRWLIKRQNITMESE